MWILRKRNWQTRPRVAELQDRNSWNTNGKWSTWGPAFCRALYLEISSEYLLNFCNCALASVSPQGLLVWPCDDVHIFALADLARLINLLYLPSGQCMQVQGQRCVQNTQKNYVITEKFRFFNSQTSHFALQCVERSWQTADYRAEKKGWYVVAWYFFLALLCFSAWPCLAVA